MMLRKIKPILLFQHRHFKNFGHKRQPVPTPTVLWHGFLTFTFIGLAIEWKRIARFIFGDDYETQESIMETSSITIDNGEEF